MKEGEYFLYDDCACTNLKKCRFHAAENFPLEANTHSPQTNPIGACDAINKTNSADTQSPQTKSDEAKTKRNTAHECGTPNKTVDTQSPPKKRRKATITLDYSNFSTNGNFNGQSFVEGQQYISVSFDGYEEGSGSPCFNEDEASKCVARLMQRHSPRYNIKIIDKRSVQSQIQSQHNAKDQQSNGSSFTGIEGNGKEIGGFGGQGVTSKTGSPNLETARSEDADICQNCGHSELLHSNYYGYCNHEHCYLGFRQSACDEFIPSQIQSQVEASENIVSFDTARAKQAGLPFSEPVSTESKSGDPDCLASNPPASSGCAHGDVAGAVKSSGHLHEKGEALK